MEITPEEQTIIEVIIAARKVQDFLWGDYNGQFGVEEFRRMLRKRVQKMDEVSLENPYCLVEIRKRLLQTAAIAVQAIYKIDSRILTVHGQPDAISNLNQFSEPLVKL